MSYIYRKAEKEDAEKINNLFVESFVYHEKWDVDLDQNFPKNNGSEYFSNKIEKDFVFICILDGELVGCIVGKIYKSIFFKSKTAELEHIVVKESHRNKNVGRELSNRFSIWAKENNCNAIYVTYSTENSRAANFYEKDSYLKAYTILRKSLG